AKTPQSIISTAAGIDLTAAATLIDTGTAATVPGINGALVGITNLSAAQVRLGADAETIISVITTAAGLDLDHLAALFASGTNIPDIIAAATGLNLNHLAGLFGLTGDNITLPNVIDQADEVTDLPTAATNLGSAATIASLVGTTAGLNLIQLAGIFNSEANVSAIVTAAVGLNLTPLAGIFNSEANVSAIVTAAAGLNPTQLAGIFDSAPNIPAIFAAAEGINFSQFATLFGSAPNVPAIIAAAPTYPQTALAAANLGADAETIVSIVKAARELDLTPLVELFGLTGYDVVTLPDVITAAGLDLTQLAGLFGLTGDDVTLPNVTSLAGDIATLDQAADLFGLADPERTVQGLVTGVISLATTDDRLTTFAAWFTTTIPVTYPALLNSVDLTTLPALMTQAATNFGLDASEIVPSVADAAGSDQVTEDLGIAAGYLDSAATFPAMVEGLIGLSTNLNAAAALVATDANIPAVLGYLATPGLLDPLTGLFGLTESAHKNIPKIIEVADDGSLTHLALLFGLTGANKSIQAIVEVAGNTSLTYLAGLFGLTGTDKNIPAINTVADEINLTYLAGLFGLAGTDKNIPAIVNVAADIGDLTQAANLIDTGTAATVPGINGALVAIDNLDDAQVRLGAGAATIISVVGKSAGFDVGNIVSLMGSTADTIDALLVTLNSSGVGTNLSTSLTVLGIEDGATHNIPGVLEAVAGISGGNLTSAQTLLGAPANTPQSIISTATGLDLTPLAELLGSDANVSAVVTAAESLDVAGAIHALDDGYAGPITIQALIELAKSHSE
ncbi:MAG: hypothetical protein LBL30_01700, partial [Holosporales bacterium]|nr:hypothetical protein [Holosporales bacterium]